MRNCSGHMPATARESAVAQADDRGHSLDDEQSRTEGKPEAYKQRNRQRDHGDIPHGHAADMCGSADASASQRSTCATL